MAKDLTHGKDKIPKERDIQFCNFPSVIRFPLDLLLCVAVDNRLNIYCFNMLRLTRNTLLKSFISNFLTTIHSIFSGVKSISEVYDYIDTYNILLKK